MFQFLSEKFTNAIRRLKGEHKITEQNIKATLKEIRRALVAADVHYNIAKAFVHNVKKKALDTEVKIPISPRKLFIKIVLEELTALMRQQQSNVIRTEGNPGIILLVGLQGAGKTTLAGKLAYYWKKQNKQVLLTSCDCYRPAAMDQLALISQDIDVDGYFNREGKPQDIAQEAIEYAREHHKKVVIVDTAGRQIVDKNMMDEVALLKKQLRPTETLFVVDAMMGQTAVDTARAFHEQVAFDGVIVTKMDSDTPGGIVLNVLSLTGKPIKMVGIGEKMMDLEPFHPDRTAKRILGMGDVVSLVEKAQQVWDTKEAKRLSKKLRKQEFNFNDFLKQINKVRSMGPLRSLLSAIPGMGKKIMKNALDESAFKDFEVMIQSMKPKERQDPKLLDYASRLRVARGSGLGEEKVNFLLKQFEQMRLWAKKSMKKGNYLDQLEKINVA